VRQLYFLTKHNVVIKTPTILYNIPCGISPIGHGLICITFCAACWPVTCWIGCVIQYRHLDDSVVGGPAESLALLLTPWSPGPPGNYLPITIGLLAVLPIVLPLSPKTMPTPLWSSAHPWRPQHFDLPPFLPLPCSKLPLSLLVHFHLELQHLYDHICLLLYLCTCLDLCHHATSFLLYSRAWRRLTKDVPDVKFAGFRMWLARFRILGRDSWFLSFVDIVNCKSLKKYLT